MLSAAGLLSELYGYAVGQGAPGAYAKATVNYGPTIVKAASLTAPGNVTGKSANLTVSANDPQGATWLYYLWKVTSAARRHGHLRRQQHQCRPKRHDHLLQGRDLRRDGDGQRRQRVLDHQQPANQRRLHAQRHRRLPCRSKGRGRIEHFESHWQQRSTRGGGRGPVRQCTGHAAEFHLEHHSRAQRRRRRSAVRVATSPSTSPRLAPTRNPSRPPSAASSSLPRPRSASSPSRLPSWSQWPAGHPLGPAR